MVTEERKAILLQDARRHKVLWIEKNEKSRSLVSNIDVRSAFQLPVMDSFEPLYDTLEEFGGMTSQKLLENALYEQEIQQLVRNSQVLVDYPGYCGNANDYIIFIEKLKHPESFEVYRQCLTFCIQFRREFGNLSTNSPSKSTDDKLKESIESFLTKTLLTMKDSLLWSHLSPSSLQLSESQISSLNRHNLLKFITTKNHDIIWHYCIQATSSHKHEFRQKCILHQDMNMHSLDIAWLVEFYSDAIHSTTNPPTPKLWLSTQLSSFTSPNHSTTSFNYIIQPIVDLISSLHSPNSHNTSVDEILPLLILSLVYQFSKSSDVVLFPSLHYHTIMSSLLSSTSSSTSSLTSSSTDASDRYRFVMISSAIEFIMTLNEHNIDDNMKKKKTTNRHNDDDDDNTHNDNKLETLLDCNIEYRQLRLDDDDDVKGIMEEMILMETYLDEFLINK